MKVVNGVYVFVHDEKLKLKVCLKTYIECTKNNQTLTWCICKIIICSTLGFSEKNFLVCQHYLGLCWYVVLGYAISYKYQYICLYICISIYLYMYVSICIYKILDFNIKNIFFIEEDIQFRHNSVHLYNSHSQSTIILQIYQTSNTSHNHIEIKMKGKQ